MSAWSKMKRVFGAGAATPTAAEEIGAWEARGRPAPPPHAVKQRNALDLARRHGARTFVETGTFRGDMVEVVRAHFDVVYSIELDAALHDAAKRRFAGCDEVRLLRGDSALVLGELVPTLQGPCLFWLDGHYSGGETARSDKDTPIVAELRHVAAHPERGHVVLIDDARLFNGENDYPTLDEMRTLCEGLFPGHDMAVDCDAIVVAPRS